MKSLATTPDEYLASLPADRKPVIEKLRRIIVKNLPKGFVEIVDYGMLAYVVPHSVYPPGYHCNPKKPLPFLSLASQKQHVTLHHLGLYAGVLLDWLVDEGKKRGTPKLDLGKGCVRWRDLDAIPYDLVGDLARRLTPQAWIEHYERSIKR